MRRQLAGQRHDLREIVAGRPAAVHAAATTSEGATHRHGVEHDVIRVEGRLTENDPAKLDFGMKVELTMVPFTTDDDGNEIVTFAFQPV